MKAQTTKQQILKQYFGYDSFREGQERLIDSILSGRDCLGIMPTGSGKSLCFQVPALMLDGITLVISPLISLMKDQVNALTQSGVNAAFINSSLTERQIRLVLSRASEGAYKIIYIAPERLEEQNFINFAQSSLISMVTIDEAHCISQWGQDFRPSYMRIPCFLNGLSSRPVVSSFTATATQLVRQDIVNLLELRDPDVLVAGFDRKNLFFSVKKPTDKFAALGAFLADKKDKYGIVYCSTRNTVEDVCQLLNTHGYKALRYHAGLTDTERHNNQDDFLYDRAQIMVATNAFGMGIDKSNVSFVVHYNMPMDIESYYQEAGRAGRDGEPADCLLLYGGQDVRTNMFLIENNKDATYSDPETERMLKERARQRLKTMTFYCHTSDCLRAYFLKYFGERAEGFCGNCDNCNTNFESSDIKEDAQKILSCVIRVKERYGIKTIIDIIRGSKNEKIMRLGLHKLSTYNISRLSEKRLRDIINHLVLNEYLYITDDQYPVLKRGSKALELLQENTPIEMKLVREDHDEYISAKKPEAARPVNRALLDELKALRLEIANENKVPAYVIFSDSALTDMCMKLPANEEEFLNISGVGQVKLQRYGERFLKAISGFSKEDASVVEAVEEAEDLGQLDPGDIETSDEAVTISVIADRINCLLLPRGIKKLTGAKINDWLTEEGYLKIITTEKGRNFKVPTERGEELGISAEKRNIRGEDCFINFFSNDAQVFVVNNLRVQ